MIVHYPLYVPAIELLDVLDKMKTSVREVLDAMDDTPLSAVLELTSVHDHIEALRAACGASPT